jgi:hypothetical protein
MITLPRRNIFATVAYTIGMVSLVIAVMYGQHLSIIKHCASPDIHSAFIETCEAAATRQGWID